MKELQALRLKLSTTTDEIRHDIWHT